jgi:hypothetical protein
VGGRDEWHTHRRADFDVGVRGHASSVAADDIAHFVEVLADGSGGCLSKKKRHTRSKQRPEERTRRAVLEYGRNCAGGSLPKGAGAES